MMDEYDLAEARKNFKEKDEAEQKRKDEEAAERRKAEAAANAGTEAQS